MSFRPGRAVRGFLATVLLMSAAVPAGAIGPPEVEPPDEERTPLADAAKPVTPEVPDKTWNVDAHGDFNDTVPLEVPAFHELAPELALKYRSSGGNGVVGTGWTLAGVAEIERAGAGRGAPKYDASDVFLLDGQELVPCTTGSVSPSCTTGGTHATENESYVRIALTGTGAAARWTVTTKDGTRRIFAPTSSTGTDLVFRWGLSQVIDTLGNTVTYTWAVDRFGCCWDSLESIAYNGVTVTFHYETRPDNDQRAAGNGVLSTTRGRIKTVDVKVGDNRVRAYKLSYAVSTATQRSLLTSVQQFGKDAVLDATGTLTGGSSLPAAGAAYQNGTPSFASGSSATMGNKSGTRYLSMDVNGDGRSDLVELFPSWTTFERRVWLSNGTAFTLASNVDGMPLRTDTRFLSGDANGDGKDDLIEIYQKGFNWGRRLYLSDGTNLNLSSTGTSAGNNSGDSRFLAMDVSGDGKTDVVELYSCGIFPTNYCRATWLSDGTAFTLASSDPGIGFSASTRFVPADVNGDGRSDLVEVYSAGLMTAGRHIWLSNGTGFVSGAIDTRMNYGTDSRFLPMDVNGDDKTDLVELYPFANMFTRRTWISTGYGYTLGSTDAVMGYAENAQQLVADVNGDQRADLVELAPYGLSTRRRIWLSTGAGFAGGATDTGIGSFSCSDGNCTSQFLQMDVNGDGLGEMTEIHQTNFGLNRARHVWNLSSAVPDLLTGRTDPYGATTAVAYTPSSAWTNTTNPPTSQTATAVTVGDGRGSTAATKYSYAGGAYDRRERQALGFRTQRETAPCVTGETACPVTDTWFRQDLAALGEPERRERRSGSGVLLGATIQEFTTDSSTLPRTALPTGTWENISTGDGATCPGADCKRKYTTRQYNAYGEVVQQVEHGDNETTGDERTTVTTFVPNPTAYVVNKPAAERRYQGVGTTGTKLTETLRYYDGAASWDQAPVKGLATRNGEWLSSAGAYADSRKEYDDWGNVTAEIDPLGARTELGWDSARHAFQTSEKNALGHQVAATWDAVCGQPTQVRNPDGQVTTVAYDALCRRAEMTEPGGKFERYTWVGVGDAGAQYEQTERPGADGTGPHWSRRYFDGLQRTWRTAEKGPDATTGDIYVDSAYNGRGQVESKTAEYYWVAGQPKPVTYPTLTAYDALDRVTKVTLPGGATRTKSYGLWSTTETDERGNATTDRVNAYDKRVASSQKVGGVTRTATYAYDGRDFLVRSTDPDGNEIVYTRDSSGNATEVVDPDSGVTRYEWDAAGRVVAQTDAKGQRTTFGYDALGRKTGQVSKAGTAAAVTATWRYDEPRAGYFNTGQATTLIDSAGTRTSDYDAAGRVVKSVRTIGGTAYTFQYGFDAGDRALWTTYPDGYSVGTAAAPLRYDGAGRVLAIPGLVDAARYTAAGELTRLENTNGTVTTRGFDAERGLLNAISTQHGATVIQSSTFARDARGNITKATSPFAGESFDYTYDEAEQLTKAGPSTVTYDGTGNISTNSELGAYTYGSARPHAVTTAGPNTYTYDAAGLMTSGAGRTMTWDGENRLATVARAGVTTTFTYDGEGARIQAVEGGTTRRYLGDDYEVDVTAGTATKYVSIAGTLVARAEGSTPYWVHTDPQGSVQAVTDASGNEVHRKKYAAFGEVLSAGGSLAREPRGFTGQREDAAGLVYLHSRYYDPELARFVSPNPVIDGEDTIGLNRYAYAANDPVNHADRTGLDCEDGGKRCDRNNWVRYGEQKTAWSCGPAAVRVALSAQGVVFENESDLYGPLDTDSDGTDSIGGNVVPVMNRMLNTTWYESKDIPGSVASPESIEMLRADIQRDINENRLIVANVTGGAAQDVDGDYHQYPGHYVAVVGYDDYGRTAHVYDSADVNGVHDYWMSTDNLATWIAGKGYAG